MGVVGKDKHTVLRENMMRSLDPANPKAYLHTPNYIQQTSSPFDRIRFGGTDKDVISRTSSPSAQRLGSLWNIALGTAGEPFKEIAAPGIMRDSGRTSLPEDGHVRLGIRPVSEAPSSGGLGT